MPRTVEEQLAFASLQKDVLEHIATELARELFKRDRHESAITQSLKIPDDYRTSDYTQALLRPVPRLEERKLKAEAAERTVGEFVARLKRITR